MYWLNNLQLVKLSAKRMFHREPNSQGMEAIKNY